MRFISLICLVASCGLVFTFQGISIPRFIAANQSEPFRVHGHPWDIESRSYCILLTISPQNNGWRCGPACYLHHEIPVNTTSLDIRVPASVGPSAAMYYVSILEYENEPKTHQMGDYTRLVSFIKSDFVLYGGTGSWTAAELHGGRHAPADAINLPCSAYDCARHCHLAFDSPQTTFDRGQLNATYECVLGCPGVIRQDYNNFWHSYVRFHDRRRELRELLLYEEPIKEHIAEQITKPTSAISYLAMKILAHILLTVQIILIADLLSSLVQVLPHL